MKFIVENWWLILLAATSGSLLLWQSFGKDGALAGGVAPAEAVRLINRERAVLIDVREPDEFAAGRPGGARNVPLARLEPGAKELPTNKTLPLVLVCATGARSARAVAKLRAAGHERVVSLAGGLRAWREAGLPVERSA